jgi:polyisoprenyl-phosphate glycosyltransferase
MPKISIVIPLYNESEVFNMLIERLDKILEKADFDIEVVLVDDGSKDDTPIRMRLLALQNKQYQSVFLSRNYGHQIALSAGLKYATGTEAILIIDGDLQDPPELLFDFYEHIKSGHDVVYAVRKKRKESYLKKLAYSSFYKLLNNISYIDIPLDSGDFSMISRRVVNIINDMPEQSRFIRGMRTWIGFKQIGVEYEREKRAMGEPKYNFKMLFRLAYDGIFNFSEVPLKLLTKIGVTCLVVAFIYFVITLYQLISGNGVPQGFTALLFMIILFGGIQLISIGILGEYLFRIFIQTKNRPLFIIRERIINQVSEV